MLIPNQEGDFLITITSDRGVPVVKLTEDEKTLAEGSSLVNREFKAHLKAAGTLTVTESLTGTALTLEARPATPLAVQAIPVAMGVKHLVRDSEPPLPRSRFLRAVMPGPLKGLR